MNIEKEREKRDFLIQNYLRLSKDLNSLIKTNLNTISSTLRSNFINKIEDWPRKVVLLRVCDWINQIKQQINEMVLFKNFKFDSHLKSNTFSKSNSHFKFITSLPFSDCSHKSKRLNLKEIDNELLNNLLKTEFVYLKIKEKCSKEKCEEGEEYLIDNLLSDYFFTTKLDLKTGIIEFYGKEDKMQIIEPNLKLDNFPNINSHFNEPLTLKIGINSLKFFLFKTKIEIGLKFFKKLTEMRLCDLEKKTYSHEIEENFVKFIRKEEILNEKFKEILYKEIENFLNFLFRLDCENFKKFLITNLIFNCFPLCLCEFDTKKIEKSKYFYLVKWMVL